MVTLLPSSPPARRVLPGRQILSRPSGRGQILRVVPRCLGLGLLSCLLAGTALAGPPRKLTLTPDPTSTFEAQLEAKSGGTWRLTEPRSTVVSVAFEPVSFERIHGDESLLVVEADVSLRDLRWRGVRLQLDLLDEGGRRLSRTSSPSRTADRDGHAERDGLRVTAKIPANASQMVLHWILEGDGDPLVPGSSFAEMRAITAWRSPAVTVSDSSSAGFLEPGEPLAFEVAVDQPGATVFGVLVDAIGRERGRFTWDVTGDESHIHEVSGLETGWYAWRWQLIDGSRRELQAGELPFVVLDAARPRRVDGPFGVDTALTSGFRAGGRGATERVERLSALLDRIGLRHVRERVDMRRAAKTLDEPQVKTLATVSRIQHAAGLNVTATFYKIPMRFALEARTAAAAGPPQDLRDLERSLAAVAGALTPWVSAWELWNEPNIFFFAGRSEEYAGVAKAAALGVRRGAPEATITSGSWTLVDEEWISAAMESGLSDSYDVFNYHHYRPLERTAESIAAMNALERRHGVDRPDWISETAERFAGGEHGDRRRAVGYVQRAALARAAGADRVYSFLLSHYQHRGEEALGLFDPSWRPRRGIAALAAMTRELGAAHPLGRDPRAGDEIEILWFDPANPPDQRAASEEAVAIVWGKERTPLPEGDWPETVVDFMGVERPLPRRLGPTPIYLRGVPPEGVEPLAVSAPKIAPPAPTLSGGVVLDLRFQPATDERLGKPERKQPVPVATGDRLGVHFDAYNFNSTSVEIAPRVELPASWSLTGKPPKALTLAPGERVRLATEVVVGKVRGTSEVPRVRWLATAADGRSISPAVGRLAIDAKRLPVRVARTISDRSRYRLGRGLAWESSRSDSFAFRYRVDGAPRVAVRLDEVDASGSDGLRVDVGFARTWRGRAVFFATDDEGRRWRMRTAADPDLFDPILGGLLRGETATVVATWSDFEPLEGGVAPLRARDIRGLSVAFSLEPGDERGGFRMEPIDLIRFGD